MDPAKLRELFSVARGTGPSGVGDRRFVGADLRGAFLLRANLANGNFSGASFDHASLSGARLVAADLSESSLKGVELNGADLTGADLRAADLTEARIEGVCLTNADMRGACLKLTRGKPASVAGMRLDHATFVRSEMNDTALIELWRDGATLDDLEGFSQRVQHACGAGPLESIDAIPHSRDVALAEARHRGALLPSLAPKSGVPGAPNDVRVSVRPSLPVPGGRPPKPGDEILGVRLLEMLGRGPNGNVWKARSPDGRMLAVKIFDPQVEGGEGVAATFKRGVATLNRAILLDEKRNGALPQLYAVSLNELAFTYDYYDNGSAAGLPALRWDVARTLEFFGRLCRAVAALHEVGLTHRSLKPSNVLVDDELRPVLVDPGMLGLRDPSLPLVSADAIYRAPEEIGGESTQSPTADVYGLGRLLWFLLLGSDPEEPYHTFAKLTSLEGCPPGLIRIVRKATAHDPAARYQWVEELEVDLARYAQPELVGIEGMAPGADYPRYCISSLPVPAPMRPTLLAPVEIRLAGAERTQPQGAARPIERAVGWLGLAAVAVVGAFLFASPAPTPLAAKAFGIVATLGLALGSLLLRPFPERPLLGRFAAFGVVLAILIPLELERLAILRWKVTLEHGSDEARASVARFLARRGSRDLRGARLAGSDLRRADFGRVDLRMANLSRANLAGTNLSESDLAGADIRGADLTGADLLSSNVHEAMGWLETRCSRSTAMPRHWGCVGGHPVSVRE